MISIALMSFLVILVVPVIAVTVCVCVLEGGEGGQVVCAWVAYEPYVTPASAFKNQTYWQESQIEVHTFGCRPLGCMRTICASSCV